MSKEAEGRMSTFLKTLQGLITKFQTDPNAVIEDETTPAPASPPQEPAPPAPDAQVASELAQLKSDNEKLRKAKESSDSRIEALEQERERDKLTQKFKEQCSGFIGKADEHVERLIELAETFGDGSKQVDHYLKTERQHAEFVRKSNIFMEHGSAVAATGSSSQEYMAAAEAYAKDNKVSLSEAMKKVASENPDLYGDAVRSETIRVG